MHRASGSTSLRPSPASTSAFTPRRCAPTSSGQGWPTGGFRRRSARRGIGSVSDPRHKSVRRFVAGRLAQAAIVVFLVTTVTFVLVHLAPGDPIMAALDRPGVTEAVRQQWREAVGLGWPVGGEDPRGRADPARGGVRWCVSFPLPLPRLVAAAPPPPPPPRRFPLG